MNIYVGNLSFETSEATLRTAFAAHGEVASVNIIMDKMTGRPRGFGFVEMPGAAEAQNAIKALNGTMLDGRTLTVNEARPREERGGFGGGNRSSFGGGNRGGGNRGGFGGGNRGGGGGGGNRNRY